MINTNDQNICNHRFLVDTKQSNTQDAALGAFHLQFLFLPFLCLNIRNEMTGVTTVSEILEVSACDKLLNVSVQISSHMLHADL